MGVVLERPSKFYMVVGDIHEFNGEKLMSLLERSWLKQQISTTGQALVAVTGRSIGINVIFF